jgi:hypothetical protein
MKVSTLCMNGALKKGQRSLGALSTFTRLAEGRIMMMRPESFLATEQVFAPCNPSDL